MVMLTYRIPDSIQRIAKQGEFDEFDLNVFFEAEGKKEANDECRETVRFILSRNILCGNALTLKQVDSQGKDTEQPIIFSEWSVVLGSTVKRRDFRLDVLMRENEDANHYDTQLSLFSDDTSGFDNWEVDPITHQPIPKYAFIG